MQSALNYQDFTWGSSTGSKKHCAPNVPTPVSVLLKAGAGIKLEAVAHQKAASDTPRGCAPLGMFYKPWGKEGDKSHCRNGQGASKDLLFGEAMCIQQTTFGGKDRHEPREELPGQVIHTHRPIQ